MKPVTLAVNEDERAWALREVNLARNGARRRWQIITVIRNDQLTEWWTDLGASEDFTAPQIEMPGLLEHSVAELRSLAEEYRLGDDYWAKRQAEIAAESTVIPDMLNQLEERTKIIHNRSQFGPVVAKLRNGFSWRTALEHSNSI